MRSGTCLHMLTIPWNSFFTALSKLEWIICLCNYLMFVLIICFILCLSSPHAICSVRDCAGTEWYCCQHTGLGLAAAPAPAPPLLQRQHFSWGKESRGPRGIFYPRLYALPGGPASWNRLPQRPRIHFHACIQISPGYILTHVDDAFRWAPWSWGKFTEWSTTVHTAGTHKVEHPHATVQGHGCRIELGWGRRCQVIGRARAHNPCTDCHIWTQNSENSKNSKLKSGFPVHLESEFVKVE